MPHVRSQWSQRNVVKPPVFIIPGMTTNNSSKSERLLKIIFIVVSVIALVAFIFNQPNFSGSRHSRSSACIMNLRGIDGAKATWALENKKLPTDTPTDADLFGPTNYIRSKPECPKGGKYTLGKVGEKPKCSIPNHTY